MRLWRYGRAIERLGQRYRLEGSLGSGGMADVCLAWDEHDEREVAIKVIKPDELDQKALDRFVKEAAQIEQWNHPHILRIYSDLELELLDPAQGSIIPYIVMEYAQGGDLHKRLNPGQPYPLSAILSLFPQLCSAVSYAHAHGIIHRDLKPLNVLFRHLPDDTEQVVLSDFGLAVEVNATHYTYARGGTLPYMAPEQLRGQALPASDIFALGVILYQLCTGRLPFRRTLLDLRPHEPLKPPVPPSLVQPLLPRALDVVILTALADDPVQRFSDATLLWESARSALLSPPTRSSQSSPHGRTNPLSRPPSVPLTSGSPHSDSGLPDALPPPPSEHGNERENEQPESEDDKRKEDDGNLHPHFSSARSSAHARRVSLHELEPASWRDPLDDGGVDVEALYTRQASDLLYDQLSRDSQRLPASLLYDDERDTGKSQRFIPRASRSSLDSLPDLPLTSLSAETPAPSYAVLPPSRQRSISQAGKHTSDSARPLAARPSPTQQPVPRRPRTSPMSAFWPFKSRLSFVLPLILIIFLVVGVPLMLIPGIRSTLSSLPIGFLRSPTITIVPDSKSITHTYAATAVTSTPDPANSQIPARLLSSTQQRTKSVDATGTTSTPATTARGTLTILNGAFVSQSVPAGTILLGKDGVKVVSDVSVMLSAGDPNTGASVSSVAAHAVIVGKKGNIPAMDINTTCCVANGTIFVKNLDAFTGGQDAQNYKFIQQSDVDGVANPLKTSLIHQGLHEIKAQIAANEVPVIPVQDQQCDVKTTTDRPVGDKGMNVPATTVTVTAKCQVEVYDQQAAQTLATRLLKDQARNEASSYALVGNIQAKVTVQSVDAQNAVALSIAARGLLLYQFSVAQQEALTRAVAGKDSVGATRLLKQMSGVRDVFIQGVGATLPTDATQITLIIQNPSGT